MNPSASDFYYLALMAHNIRRDVEATNYIHQMVDTNEPLTEPQRNIIGSVFKSSVDPIRNTIRCLNDNIAIENSTGKIHLVEKLNESKDDAIQKLTDICNEGIDMLENKLLKRQLDIISQIHYQKIRGDLYRYLIEINPDSESNIKNAKEAYSFACDQAELHLEANIPIRLGAILNYAVFKYEHLSCVEDAIEMLQHAVLKYQDCKNEIDPYTRAEAVNIVMVIESNIKNWTTPESDEEEEEEDHDETDDAGDDSPEDNEEEDD